MIDLTEAGIARLAGLPKTGRYAARITSVSSAIAAGGARTWFLTWKCTGKATPVVEDVLISVGGFKRALALRRLADILRVNDKPLTYQRTGELVRALVGCQATIAVATDPWHGGPVVVADPLKDENRVTKPGNGAGVDCAHPPDGAESLAIKHLVPPGSTDDASI